VNSKLIAVLGLAISISSPLVFAQTVDAPEGWIESVTDQGRILTIGNTVVSIGNWQNLNGVSLLDYLDNIKNSAPDNGTTVVSDEGVKPDEQSDGVFYVIRHIQSNGKPGFSALYGCPGQPGHARIITVTAYDKNYPELLSAGMHIDTVCKTEPRGKGTQGSKTETVTTRKETISDKTGSNKKD